MKFIHALFLMFVSSYSFKNIKHIRYDSRIFIKKDRSKFLDYPQTYVPKNINQEKYLKYLNNNTVNIVVSVGPAGTGKTMFACIKAIELLKSGNLKKIVITRPVVAVEEEELGFLPGNLVKKMDPWTRPIMDIFMEYFSKTEIDNMIFNNIIEISPLAYMRGRTFKNAFIIADEMQNSSPNQMLMLTTRIGTNSRLIITGDLKQTDRTINNNGLSDFINKVTTYKQYHNDTNNIEIVEFKKDDIERSKIVQTLINIYEFKNKNEQLRKNIVEDSDAALIPLNRMPKKNV